MRTYLWAVFILFTMLVFADVDLKADGPGGEQSEQQVIYQDMIDAYKKGQFSEARKLARSHLQRFSNDMSAADETERESAVHASLDIINLMLEQEGQLPASKRFENDRELLDYAEAEMSHAKDVFGRLSKPDEPRKAFIKDKLGKDSEDWIRAADAVVPRKRMDDHHNKFRSELTAKGHANVNSVLTRARPGVPQAQGAPQASDEDRTVIFTLIDNFYTGVVTGDIQKISAVSGLNANKAAEFLEVYRSDLRSKDISAFVKVTLPDMSADNYTIQQSISPDIYSVAIQGIKMDVIHMDGSQAAIMGDKLLNLRKDVTGGWQLVLPEKKQK